MRSWERALSFGAALALGFGCGAAGDSPGGDSMVRGGGGSTAVAAGTGGGSGSSAGGGGDFGNNPTGTPPPPSMQFSDGGGVNMTTNPDDVKCGGDKFTPEIEMEVIPGNILLVFDKSGSMRDEWGAGNARDKWTDAVAAIPAAVEPLEDQVTIGSVFFPFGDDCTVPGPNMAPHIPFKPGPDFLGDWANLGMVGVTPDGGTPLRAALMVADLYLQAELPDLVGITSVVIVTDGQPNCADTGGFNDDDTAPNLTPFLANWLAQDIKTYVVGLPAGENAEETMTFVNLLNDLAIAGGTMQYIPADDQTTLQEELAKIVSENVTTNFDTCTLPLDMKPPDPDDVNLLVVNKGVENSVDRDLGASGGWTIDAASENVILQGTFCELAKMGEYDEITVVYGCVEAPPLEPPPPLI